MVGMALLGGMAEMTTPTTRSKARYARAAAVLAKVTLNAAEHDALRSLMVVRGISSAALIRTLLLEAAGLKNPECPSDTPV